ncbi:sigma factor-like helix-turn-helix DNA-binding protein [Candidatus Frackibacter sp. WG13]|uniref:sigma factor-like helix-turn-helix DNA-binding protein n=2 Tax=Candidatus Frackibacter TaxID=2017975 RepID=UPI0015A631B9|nr:sigma factor-like helix-turn-helix DNA-binding protein [Candidatus Frackibacter sp. WG13]
MDYLKELIEEKLNNKQEKLIFSVKNLAMRLFSRCGEELSKKEIIKFLDNDKRFLQINSRQFIVKEEVLNLISDEFINESEVNEDYQGVTNRLINVIKSNFPVFEISKNTILKSLKKKALVKYNQENTEENENLDTVKQDENSNQLKKFNKDTNDKIQAEMENSVDSIYEVFNSRTYKMFRNFCKAKGIKSIRGINKDLLLEFRQQKGIGDKKVKDVKNKLLKFLIDRINTLNIKSDSIFTVFRGRKYRMFREFCKIKGIKTIKQIRKDLFFDFKQQRNIGEKKAKDAENRLLKFLINKYYRSNIKNNKSSNKLYFDKVLEKLKEPKDINELKEDIKIDVDDNVFIYSLLSHGNIYYDNGYLVKKKEPQLADSLQKVGMVYKYTNNKLTDYNLQVLIDGLLKHSHKPMTIEEIEKALLVLDKRIDLNEIEEILNNDDSFKCVNYKTWINKNNKFIRHSKYKEFYGDFKQQLDEILNDLDERKKYILFNRTFISNKPTLSELGNEFGLSRERVRQLENQAIRQIMHPQRRSSYMRYFKLLEKVFVETRVMNLDGFWSHPVIKECFSNIDLDFLINFYNECNHNKEQKQIQLLYNKYLVHMKPQYYELLWRRIRNELTTKTNIAELKDIVQFFSKFMIKNEEFLKEAIFRKSNIIKIEAKLLIKEKKVYETDKIKLILSLIGKPVHYKQVAGLYNQYFTETTAHNIHSKLNSYDGDFIRVDSGTYGLTSWDCEEDIYVRDLNYQILKEEKKPLHYKEVAKKVLEHKEVEARTVYHYLIDNKRIFNYSSGLFALKEWKDDEKIASKYHINSWRIKASEQDRVYDYFLGSFNGRKGRLVSLHKISKKYYYEDHLKVSKKIIKRMQIKNQISGIDTKGRIYNLYFDQELRAFKGIKKFLKDNDLKIGDYLYVEYYSDQIVKFHKQSEYEEDYKPILETDLHQVNSNIVINEVLNASKADIKDGQRIEIVDLESAIEYGLRYGHVNFNELIKLNYNQEEVSDHFEAIQLLDRKNIEIVYD